MAADPSTQPSPSPNGLSQTPDKAAAAAPAHENLTSPAGRQAPAQPVSSPQPGAPNPATDQPAAPPIPASGQEVAGKAGPQGAGLLSPPAASAPASGASAPELHANGLPCPPAAPSGSLGGDSRASEDPLKVPAAIPLELPAATGSSCGSKSSEVRRHIAGGHYYWAVCRLAMRVDVWEEREIAEWAKFSSAVQCPLHGHRSDNVEIKSLKAGIATKLGSHFCLI